MTYPIRPATPDDEAILWQMLYEAAHMAEAGETIATAKTNPGLARYVAGWGLPDDAGFIALAGGQPAGAAWFRLFRGENKGYGYVDDQTPELAIGVLPDHRGQGAGAALLTQLIEAAQGKYPALSLSVRADNPAVRLYRRFGFEVVPGSEIVNRVGTLSFIMKLEL
jgi:ribosomal protein S18 acetylase RimI-like enzyme